ncbi:ABC transporter ATP-binding protein [Enterococcus raffinosus]|uniref:ABC transporter ATP-binding protein n=1 Tax=Enterococcus raffinosus TaxID=71452 RepID=A0AAW8T7R3_9ENTE|nr:ABC transporter ATP-binding protein [Enterococcus raffinosus]MDT2522482.1 ABC transporter ATP-binding protein [Enterococcus raffinosus]MDT2530427.1 ABC transporter ATP-binding protein [Enterococcus raffinosus]MDT2533601.1 ABC transporter ATP-binding protein [Enterococcus raffinosus]MDT2543112.1 ABC transporter ATP-binding protein [Enterococcus raffinosus]MDT2553146.1 ABC transporter ATP-binding protein [Enterococcus raffinosus]
MTTENNTVAKISHAYKAFYKREVLQDVNLQIESGKILGLIGPSGAGKSTTIKCLLGMEKLDKGETTIFETKMPNRKILGRVGYMGQSDALYNELTAKENLIFFGQLMGMEKDKLKQAIDKNMSLVNLTDFLNQTVKTYSGGMKRRLSLATTLLSNPDLIVLDEPTVGIDPSLRVAIWDQLRSLADQNKAIVVTTHVMDEAEKCDYVGLIIDGKLFAFGTPTELKQKFEADSIEEVFLKAEVES